MRRLAIALTAGLILALPILLLLQQAKAVPRYSARYEQNCTLCHVNPTGGGMRSLYASQFLVPEELTMKTPSDEVIGGIQPEIAPNITVGADFRTMYFYSDAKAHTLNFFEMQGDLYVNFQMDRLGLYFDKGITQSYELFGLAWVLPYDGYAKVGRFIPAYGVKFADHTMFTRQYAGFMPPAHTDVGVELGTYPGPVAVNLSLMNGASGRAYDNNDKLAVLLRGAWRFNVSDVGVMVGASGRHNPYDGRNEDAGAVFGSLFAGPFVWTGEFDLLRSKPDNQEGTKAIVTSHELTWLVHRGVDIIATYDYQDPDSDYKTGSRQRYGGGVYLFPSPFVAVEALVRAYDFTQGTSISEDDYIETVLQLHFLY